MAACLTGVRLCCGVVFASVFAIVEPIDTIPIFLSFMGIFQGVLSNRSCHVHFHLNFTVENYEVGVVL